MRTSDLDTPDLNKSKISNILKVLLAIVVLLGIIGLILWATGVFDDDDLCASVTCPDASDVCKVAGSCQPVSGTCSTETNVSNGTLCDDNDPATTGTVCTAGVCGAAADDANDDAADDANDDAADDANDDAADDANVDCAFAWSQCSVHCGRRFNSDATDEQRSVCPEPPCLAGDGACPDAPNVDCAGTWSPCTAACERPFERRWIETASQSGSGAACPAAQRCRIDEGGCSEGWVLAERQTSCTTACNGVGKICTAGNWTGGQSRGSIITDANLEVLVEGVPHQGIVLEDPGQKEYYPFLDTSSAVPAVKFADPDNTSDCDQYEMGANADNIQRLCKCVADVNVDCAGTWSPCTTGCEKAHERQWTETAPQSGSGAACPLPQDCQIGEGACLDTWTLSEPAQSCTDACTALSGSCTPESHNNLSNEAPITSIINDVLGDQLAGVTTQFWDSQQAYIPIVSGNFEKIVYNDNADATFNCEVDAPTHIVEGVGDWRRICHCL